MKKHNFYETFHIEVDKVEAFRRALENTCKLMELSNDSIKVSDIGMVQISPTNPVFLINLGIEFHKELTADKDEMINFMYFISNFPSGFIQKVWKDEKLLADHLQSKLEGFIARSGASYVDFNAFVGWFFQLTTHNQVKLIRWVTNNYNMHGKTQKLRL